MKKPIFESQKMLATVSDSISCDADGVFGFVHREVKFKQFVHGVSISDMADIFESAISDLESTVGQAIRLALARKIGERQVSELLN